MNDVSANANENSASEEVFRFDDVSHISNLESAVSIVKKGCIDSSLERQKKNPLTGTGLEIVWFSPNDWQNYKPNAFGCVAFEFDFNRLLEIHGDHIYDLGVADSRMETHRILLSLTDHPPPFTLYPAKADQIPWTRIDNRHTRRQHGVLHIAVECTHIPIDALVGLRFVDQNRGMRDGKTLYSDVAARCFLARLVGEQAPSVRGFCGLRIPPEKVTGDETNCFFEGFRMAVRAIFDSLTRNYKSFTGQVRECDSMSDSLARAVLDRMSRFPAIGPYGNKLVDDARSLSTLFATKSDFVESVRRVVAEWAGIDPKLLKNI